MRVAVVIGRYPADRYSLHRGYVDALCEFGATPVLIPASEGCGWSVAAELLFDCDGLIMTGGGDLEPAMYEAPSGGDVREVDVDRDAVDVRAVRTFHAMSRPVLGICRGAQAIAVATGGTLVQDLPTAGFDDHWHEAKECEPAHRVEAEPGSCAADVLAGATEVNSIHHQAIADPGASLRATAWSPDGVIEAAEAPGLLALQWHPERLLANDSRHLAPFEWLVKRG
ncbi:MAG: putative glutamine amidotransferase [Actinomycetota bacterium]|nr:putative glutamine amidotransferase [Actinomycetota bacterium]